MTVTTTIVGSTMGFVSKATSTPKPNPHDTQMCKSHALFLHALPDGFLFLWPFLFAAAAIIFTQTIRANTPGVIQPPAPKADAPVAAPDIAQENAESSAIPAAAYDVDVEAGQEGSEDPPAYAPPEPTPIPSTTSLSPAAPAEPLFKRSSANLFVLGTFLMVPLLVALLCLALSIQYITFCHDWSPTSTTAQVFCWLFFSGNAIFATFGVACYAMLFRDLWGPAAKKKFPIEEHILLKVTLGTIACMIAFPFIGLAKLLTIAIEAAQRRWCLDSLADDEDVEIGELRGAVEVDAESQGVRVEGESSEGGVERHEETVGLIKGMET